MERRFYLGIGILCLLLILGVLASFWVDNINRQITAPLEQAEAAIRSGMIPQAKVLAQQASDIWQKCRHRLAAVADHAVMEEIDSVFSQIIYYMDSSQASFGASCAKIRQLITSLSDTHRLTWWNVL